MLSWTELKSILQLGWRQAPQVTRVAIGAFVLFSVTTLILSTRIAPSILFPSVLSVTIIGFIATLAATASAGPSRQILGAVFGWSIVLFSILISSLFTVSAFTDWLPRGSVIVARTLDAPEVISVSKNYPVIVKDGEQVSLKEIRSSFPAMLPGDRFERIKALAERPSLVIQRGGVLRVGSSGDSDVLAVHTLELEGGTILTGGANFDLTAVRLISSGNGTIRAFADPSAPISRTDNGTVTITILDKIDGALTVDLSGGAGRQGSPGGPGAPGAPGTPGDNAASGAFDCKRGAGAGGRGLPGSPGSPGEKMVRQVERAATFDLSSAVSRSR